MQLGTVLAMLTQAQAAIQSGRLLIDLVSEQVELAKRNGQLTPEQIELIEHQQRNTQQQWDDAVAEAKVRLTHGSPAPGTPGTPGR